jgi:hypothetical protein
MASMDSSDCVLFSGDARLADYGSLLVFRHWLRCQLQEMAGLDDAALYPFRSQSASKEHGGPEPAAQPGQARSQDESYGRLFF